MGCGYLLSGHLAAKRNPETGKRSVIFSGSEPILQDKPIYIRCGQCLGCKIEHAKQYAIRCLHEAHYYENNIFITLTFNNESLNAPRYKKGKQIHLPHNSLCKQDFQNFLKRLRKKYPQTIRYFHCGEYGTICKTCEKSPNSSNLQKRCNCGPDYIKSCGRPHHHALLFNIDFPDKEYLRTNKKGQILYSSVTLDNIWGHGYTSLGQISYDSCAYVAQYVTKKTKTETDNYYGNKQHEYVTMSRRPGLGTKFYNEFKETDMYNQGYVLINNKKLQIPKFYNNKYDIDNPKEYAKIKAERIRKMRDTPAINDPRIRNYNHSVSTYKFNKNTERQLDNA